MSQKAFYVVVGFLLGIVVCLLLDVGHAGAQVPPRPNQPRPDIFPCDGCTITDKNGDGVANMQDLSPVNIKAKATRSIRYRVVTLSGCLPGSMMADLDYMNRVEAPKVGLDLAIDNVNFDFTVYISCGLTQINKCGGVNVFCLPDSFPYKSDVYMSDVLSGWEKGSRVGIPIHEILGHAIAIWNEQYGASFQPSPNFRHVMNTGPESRHGIEQLELEMWERTMWSLQAPSCGRDPAQPSGLAWDSCAGRWVNASGWSYDPSNGTWYTPQGNPEWNACNADKLRWNPHVNAWLNVGHGFFDPKRGYWSFAPAC